MEAMDIFLAASRDLSYSVLNHPIYSAIGCFIISLLLLNFYCRLTCGMCECEEDMEGKTVLITGASAGIGTATTKDLSRRKARVIMACRNLGKAESVTSEIKATTGNHNVVVVKLDLTSFQSVRECAENILKNEEKLHVLINNAGIFASKRELTEDGCEKVLQANHLGHFLLTLLLLDLLKKSAPSRIINVSSGAYTFGKMDLSDMSGKAAEDSMYLYSRSKLANILFTKELASRLVNTGVTVNALHPGVVKTNIMDIGSSNLFTLFTMLMMAVVGKSTNEGAQTSIYLAVNPELEKVTGKYFVDCKEQTLKNLALDKEMAKKFFEESEKLVGTSYSQFG